jgi:hypothetical protein
MDTEPAYLQSDAFSRRAFLRLSLLAGVVTAVAGCKAEASSSAQTPSEVLSAPSFSDAVASSGPPSVLASPSLSTVPPPESSTPSLPTREQSSDIHALLESSDESIQGIGDLEMRCNNPGLFGGVLHDFIVSNDQANDWQISALSESVAAKLLPITSLDLDNLDISKPAEAYRLTVRAYFDTLFKGLAGNTVLPDQLGPLTVVPEFIAGFNGNAEDFPSYLDMFLSELHDIAPTAPASTMIDLSDAAALVPTLGRVQHADYLQSVGLQAFSNDVLTAFRSDGSADISSFLDIPTALSILKGFGNKPVWLNTGIVKHDANKDVGNITYTTKQRIAVADAIGNFVAELIQQGAKVEIVNIFAENKLNGKEADENDEGRDFSFHPGEEVILLTLATKLQALGVKLSAVALANDHE